jgi:hypothetical protein
VEALSSYDRTIAHGGNDDLAWASAVALKYTQISGARGRIASLQGAIAAGGNAVFVVGKDPPS